MQKRLLNSLLLVLLAVAPVHAEKWYMRVNAQVPGIVTVNDSVQNLLVVNNTPQVDDSLDFYCLMRTAEVLEEYGTFQTVSVYDRTLNTSQDVRSITRLSSEQVQTLRRQYQADALLVLNRLMMAEDGEQVHSVSNWSLYLKSDHWRAHNLTVQDTVDITEDTPDASILESSLLAAERVSQQLFTHPEQQDRYLFSNKQRDLLAGMQHFRQQEWSQALQAFERALLDKHSQTRAMAQADRAVCLELLGRTTEARTAAQAALDLFMQAQAPSSVEGVQIMQWYLTKLH